MINKFKYFTITILIACNVCNVLPSNRNLSLYNVQNDNQRCTPHQQENFNVSTREVIALSHEEILNKKFEVNIHSKVLREIFSQHISKHNGIYQETSDSDSDMDDSTDKIKIKKNLHREIQQFNEDDFKFTSMTSSEDIPKTPKEKSNYFTKRNVFIGGAAVTSIIAFAAWRYKTNQQSIDSVFANMSPSEFAAQDLQREINLKEKEHDRILLDPHGTAKLGFSILSFLGTAIVSGLGTTWCYQKIKDFFQAPLEGRIEDLEKKMKRTNDQHQHYQDKIIEIVKRSNVQDNDITTLMQACNHDRNTIRQIVDRSNEQDQQIAGLIETVAKVIQRSNKQDEDIQKTQRTINKIINKVLSSEQLQEKK